MRFHSDDRGAVAAMYALSLFALVGVAGVAFDYARVAGMDSELQNGADQAALAGASQLDKSSGACARATNAAIELLKFDPTGNPGGNKSLLANDGNSLAVNVNGGTAVAVSDDNCSAVSGITFWKDSSKTTAATTDADAAYIQVAVDVRTANYAFTPIVGVLSANIEAKALAGLGSSVCRVPPIMVCSPDPTKSIDWDDPSVRGIGILATGHSPGSSSNQGGGAGSNTQPTGSGNWSPGNFGFLQVEDPTGTSSNRNAALIKALAFDEPTVDCVPIGDNKVSTGNPQGLYDAINTRFGIYDFPSNGGSTLAPCEGGACTAAPNVIMDLQKSGSGNNSCKLKKSNQANGNGNGGKGFGMPSSPYHPTYQASPTDTTRYDTAVSKMGLPRDLCHYTSFDETGASTTTSDGLCGGSRFGDGKWGREDYWQTVHPGITRPSNWATMTRYETYEWEIANSKGQAPSCGVTGPATRRVLTVAVVKNCSELNGTAKPVVIDDFIDVFFVEPSIDETQRYNAFKDSIYLEVIGRSSLAGEGVFGAQEVRRDVPYLIE